MSEPLPLDVRACILLVESTRWTGKVQRDGDCIIWIAGRNHAGYGNIRIQGRMARAHRVAWVAANGIDIPAGLTIDHLCRNRACVNPDHLEPIGIRENTLRGNTLPAIQAAKTHCLNGHELTPDNLAPWRLPKRICLACIHKRDRLRYARRRAS